MQAKNKKNRLKNWYDMMSQDRLVINDKKNN